MHRMISWPVSPLHEIVVSASVWVSDLGLVCSVIRGPFTTGACWSLSWYALPAHLDPSNSEINQWPSCRRAHYLCNYLFPQACFISVRLGLSAAALPDCRLHLSEPLDFYHAGGCDHFIWWFKFDCTANLWNRAFKSALGEILFRNAIQFVSINQWAKILFYIHLPNMWLVLCVPPKQLWVAVLGPP